MKRFLLIGVLMLAAMFTVNAQVNVTSDITTNTTWTSNNIYILGTGFIYITNNATLTIQPGTLIKSNGGTLVVTRGSKLVADGNANQPIVFTSAQPNGFRAPGDWGGIIICGRAPINDPAGERLAEGGIDPVKGLYGGGATPDAQDSSGVLRYVRIEYAGIAYQPNNETNGLTMGGVGSKTIIDYVQVSFGGDDAFEWFGGTVNARHLIAYRSLDDEFDSDYGWTGKAQFFLSIRDSLIADISGSNGFESDNDANGTGNTPQTHPIITNVSIFGPKKTSSTSVNSNYKRAAHLKKNTALSAYNSLFTGFPVGLKIEATSTGSNAINGTLQVENNIFAGCPQLMDTAGLQTTFNWLGWFYSSGNISYTNSMDVMAGDPYNYTNPNLLPAAGSPLLSGADFSNANLQDPWFTPTTYRGAFGTTDWTACWAEFDPQNQTYNTANINTSASANVTAGGPVTFCQGGSVTLTANAGSSYMWSNGATTQSITVTQAGTYSVDVTNAYRCTATSAPVTVTVNTLPSPVVTANGSTTFCTGDSVILTSSAANGYLWSNSATTQSITVTSSGTYSVTVTDANGCQGTSNAVTVSSSAAPAPTINVQGSTSLCAGQSVTLTASAADSYLWSNSATTQSITVTSAGTYNVTVVNDTACMGTGTSSSVTVMVTPQPTATFTANSSTQPTVSFTNSSTNATGYSWNFGDGNTSVNANPTYTYGTNGTYTVTLVATNGSCSDTTTMVVSVNVGISELGDMGNVNLYPNPAGSIANIDLTLTGSADVSIMMFDMQGKAVMSIANERMNAGQHMLSVNTGELDAGIYFVKVNAGNAARIIKLVVMK
jgi:hypothetical protein